MTTINGRYFTANGTIDNLGQLKWTNMKQGKFVPFGSIKISTTPKLSVWDKTVNLAERFFAGALGSSIPFAIAAGVSYCASQTITKEQVYGMGLCTAGLGLASAASTSEPMEAFTRGFQFGSVAKVTMVCGGISEEKVYDFAKSAWLETATKANTAYDNVKTTLDDAWTKVKSWTNERIYQPVCNWSNGGKVGGLFNCPSSKNVDQSNQTSGSGSSEQSSASHTNGSGSSDTSANNQPPKAKEDSSSSSSSSNQ